MKFSLSQLSCTVALCLFFSTVNSVVKGQLRGASTKPRQLQDGEVTAAAMGGGGNMVEQMAPHTHNSATQTHNSATHTHNSAKSKKPRKTKKTKKPVFDIASNFTAVDDDDIASNITAVDDFFNDIASNTTAVDDDELEESDADEEEGEGEVRY